MKRTKNFFSTFIVALLLAASAPAFAQTVSDAPPPATNRNTEANQDNLGWGLAGLAGLLGLVGLIRRKPEVHSFGTEGERAERPMSAPSPSEGSPVPFGQRGQQKGGLGQE